MSLEVLGTEEPVEPVSTGLDPDLTAPVIEAATLDQENRTVLLEIGPTSDPADVAGVVAFYGVAEIDLRPVEAAPNASGENTVTYEALICSDGSVANGIKGSNTKEPEIVFFAADPTGNQSAPFRLSLIINGIFDSPLPDECF